MFNGIVQNITNRYAAPIYTHTFITIKKYHIAPNAELTCVGRESRYNKYVINNIMITSSQLNLRMCQFVKVDKMVKNNKFYNNNGTM